MKENLLKIFVMPLAVSLESIPRNPSSPEDFTGARVLVRYSPLPISRNDHLYYQTYSYLSEKTYAELRELKQQVDIFFMILFGRSNVFGRQTHNSVEN